MPGPKHGYPQPGRTKTAAALARTPTGMQLQQTGGWHSQSESRTTVSIGVYVQQSSVSWANRSGDCLFRGIPSDAPLAAQTLYVSLLLAVVLLKRIRRLLRATLNSTATITVIRNVV